MKIALVLVVGVALSLTGCATHPADRFSENVEKVVRSQGESWTPEVQEAAIRLGKTSCGENRREFVTEVADHHGVSVGIAISVYDNAQKYLCKGGKS